MADFHGTQEVVTDLREDGVLIMRINRPEKRNAINGATSATMEDIMNKAEKDNRVRVIVVTGTGEKAFCAGEDLSDEDFQALQERIEQAYEDLEIDAHRGDQPLYPIVFSVE